MMRDSKPLSTGFMKRVTLSEEVVETCFKDVS